MVYGSVGHKHVVAFRQATEFEHIAQRQAGQPGFFLELAASSIDRRLVRLQDADRQYQRDEERAASRIRRPWRQTIVVRCLRVLGVALSRRHMLQLLDRTALQLGAPGFGTALCIRSRRSRYPSRRIQSRGV
ncbi:hypothetical protein C7H84_22555 [Burkholderia sp. Nafp2/4-1b]|nr:hypothetical protein C7H84_22555 [Burkholderia sp. Nafp2/4-1b]